MEPRNGGTTDRLGCPEPKREKDPPGLTAKFELKLDHIAEELGGVDSLMAIARQCGDEKVRKVVDQWDALGDGEKSTASLDQLCEEAGIKAGHFLGQMMAYTWGWNLNAAKLIMSQAMPGIMQKIVEGGLESDGYRDRKMFLQGLVPAFWPTKPFPATLNGDQVTTAGAGQDEALLEIPRVEDDSVVDRMFRDLGEE